MFTDICSVCIIWFTEHLKNFPQLFSKLNLHVAWFRTPQLELSMCCVYLFHKHLTLNKAMWKMLVSILELLTFKPWFLNVLNVLVSWFRYYILQNRSAQNFSSDEGDPVLAVITVCPRTSPLARSVVEPPPDLRSIFRALYVHPPGHPWPLLVLHSQRPSERSRCITLHLCQLCITAETHTILQCII